VTGYIPRWFTCPQTVTHPSSNPAVHGWESNSQPVDHKSDAFCQSSEKVDGNFLIKTVQHRPVSESWAEAD